MRILFLIVAFFAASALFAQPEPKIAITGIVVGPDSLPVTDVAIVNIRTNATVRTNASGYFRAFISGDDSLFVYHISYRKQYITKKDNGKLIVLEPEVQEIKQVDITDKLKQEQKNLEETMGDILHLAPMKKLTGYELHSQQDYFILENGSQTRGFSPYFGPTAHLSLEKITHLIAKSKEDKEREELTSHYKIVKNKKKKSKVEKDSNQK